MNPSLAAQLLNPKAAAKEKSKKRAPNYGEFTCPSHIAIDNITPLFVSFDCHFWERGVAK